MRLSPLVFTGTMAFFFFVINLSKWVPYAWLGLLDWRNMSTSLALLPLHPWGCGSGCASRTGSSRSCFTGWSTPACS
jgi:uncharacterized protein